MKKNERVALISPELAKVLGDATGVNFAGDFIMPHDIVVTKKLMPIPAEQLDLLCRITHEVNRAYCESIGDNSQLPWLNAPSWQKESALNGVLFTLNNPNATPKDSHSNWMKEKEAAGWKYGEKKDVEKKEHPCFLPYEKLPKEQQTKDSLFVAIVSAYRTKNVIKK